jgi:hypothetical protein
MDALSVETMLAESQVQLNKAWVMNWAHSTFFWKNPI